MHRLYCDTAALTPVDPRVFRVVERLTHDASANPGSIHSEGERAHTALEEARRRVAAFCGVKSYEIVFTSGGTESNNLAIFGVVLALPHRVGHIITSTIEHSSILSPIEECARRGCAVTLLNPDSDGLIRVEQVF